MQLYQQINGVTLYQGDARKLDALADESICMVITSPPYNVGIDYGVWNDSMPPGEYWQFFEDWLREAYRVLRVGVALRSTCRTSRTARRRTSSRVDSCQ